MVVDRETKIYGSFSAQPGVNGSMFFNTEFKNRGVNAIYRPFKVENLDLALKGAIAMKFSGLGISMPFKQDVIKYCTQVSDEVNLIGACNTVLINGTTVTGYNTDWIGVKEFFRTEDIKGLSIIGEGGFSKAVQYFCNTTNIPFEVFTRETVAGIVNAKYPVFNATPENFECQYDGRPYTPQGKQIALFQAQAQLKLYLDNE